MGVAGEFVSDALGDAYLRSGLFFVLGILVFLNLRDSISLRENRAEGKERNGIDRQLHCNASTVLLHTHTHAHAHLRIHTVSEQSN